MADDGSFSFPNIFESLMGERTAPVPQPFGYTGLTADQAAMVNSQGFAYRPDAIQPGNVPWQQPTGYTNLTPDQIQAVNQQGWYTGGGVQPKSIWDQLADKLGQPGTGDALKKIMDEAGGKPAQLGPSAAAMHAGAYPGAGNPYLNIYRHLSLDPKLALKSLMGGNLY